MKETHTHLFSSPSFSVCACVCVCHNGPQKDTSQPQSSSVAGQQVKNAADRHTANMALLLLLQSDRGVCVCVCTLLSMVV